MKKAVMYGAGNIGRGFIGKTFSQSGYEVCFVDVASEIVDALNEKNEYPVKIVSNEKKYEEVVKNVRAVHGFDIDKVADEIAGADIMATAVGVNVLPKIIKPICEGLKKRFNINPEPLNIIICENLIDADEYLRGLIEKEMGQEYKQELDDKLGLIEASIGRMVPVMTEQMREGNILRVWVEPYCELPIDKDAFLGRIPQIKNLVPFSPFGFYIKRKLFIHNMGHAMCGYLGYLKGYKYIFEAAEDKQIIGLAKLAMSDSAQALNNQYKIPLQEIMDNIDDLIYRFANNVLKDTVARIGRDPKRKLKSNDRLIGAAIYCQEQGVSPIHIIAGITAALRFDNEEDAAAMEIQTFLKEYGVRDTIKKYCQIDEQNPLFDMILQLYEDEVRI